MAPSGRLRLHNVLTSKDVALGAWQSIPSTVVSRLLASSSPDLSWILLDAEHGLINDSHYYDLANAVASANVSPIIRVTTGQEWSIKRALDAGAHGVMVPMVHNADMARDIVSYSKYPPIGIRGIGPAFTHAAGATLLKYAATANNDLLVIVQIESTEGVKNINEIAAVEGIDVIFIGPYDLAVSMGVQLGSTEHEAAIEQILAACKSAGKIAAIFCMIGAEAARRREQGFDMISVGCDHDLLDRGLKEYVSIAAGKLTP